MAVGTYQGVAGLAPRLFTLEEETGSHHGHGHVHRTRMLICMHNWGSSLHLPPHRRSSIIVMRMHSRSSSRDAAASTSGGEGGRRLAHERAPVRRRRCSPSAIGLPLLLCCLHRRCRREATRPRAHLSACLLSSWARAVRVRRRLAPPSLAAANRPLLRCSAASQPRRPAPRRLPWRRLCDCVCMYVCMWGNAGNAGDAGTRGVHLTSRVQEML